MQREMRSKTCSLAGTSDLTVVAPITAGLVPALDTVTYKTRARRVLRALHAGRMLSHEQDLARLLSDAVERVGRIHSVRIVLIEKANVIVLAATFDGSWEAYVRVVWQKVARLLDLVFCNTDGYVVGGTSSFDEWAAWLHEHQAETPFLYATPGLTFDDVQYQRMHERLELRHGGADAELRIARAQVPSAEEITSSLAADGTDPTNLGHSKRLFQLDAQPPAFRQGVRALAGLYRLTDLYPPGTPDGTILQRAARELLPELERMIDRDDAAILFANDRFKDALDWFRERPDEPAGPDGVDRAKTKRQLRPPPDRPQLVDPQTIQAGILEPLPEADHGVMLLVAFPSGVGMANFLGRCKPTLRGAKPAPSDAEGSGITLNLALTLRGLERAGLTEDEVRCLPEAFTQGMQRRAGLLGDVRVNHPSRWRLPVTNWDRGVAADTEEVPPAARVRPNSTADGAPPLPSAERGRVELDAVHAVMQLRLCRTDPPCRDPRERLMEALKNLVGDGSDVKPLSLQWMHRLHDPKARSPNQTIEHFGFGEGHSDPVFEKKPGVRHFANHVHVGDALVGYGNAADEDPQAKAANATNATNAANATQASGNASKVKASDDPEHAKRAAKAATNAKVQSLLHNGSFLVVRKLAQDVGALEEAVAASGLDRDLVMAKMMGRWPARHTHASRPLVPLTDPSKLNDFHYRADPQGIACPFHAHIRRANPRETFVGELADAMAAGGRVPSIVRRGMSYGELHNREERDPAKLRASLESERGLVFMAYNASIAEQFEVIQRWLAGGNSTHSHSSPSDPFLGVAEAGRPRWFRFMTDDGRVERVRLDGSDALHDAPRPFVRVDWGLYAFAPSSKAIETLAQRARDAEAAKAEPMPWSDARGDALIEKLLGEHDPGAAKEAWKAALEDADAVADFTTASIWSAVRNTYGGVLRTPYGVLVARREWVDKALADPAVSVSGYMERMNTSFGPIFLGRDAGADYKRESEPALRAIDRWRKESDTFNKARQFAAERLDQLVGNEKRARVQFEVARRALNEPANDPLPWDLTVDMRELTDHLLARFCEQWFGLSEEGGFFERGGFKWRWKKGDPPRYPGHFMAPSRWFFQPHPKDSVKSLGEKHGQALVVAMNRFLEAHGKRLTQPAVIEIMSSSAAKGDPDYAARTIIGLIMGFVPTVDGVLRRVLAHWWTDGTLGSLRALRSLQPMVSDNEMGEAVDKAFVRAMQLRTVPDVIWRRATKPLRIGADDHEIADSHAVEVKPDEVIVFGLSSVTQEHLAEGRSTEAAVAHAFGGERGGKRAPTHACPGRDLAMQMMKGFVCALVESEHPLRPGPIPTSINVSGKVSPAVVMAALGKLNADKATQHRKLSEKRKREPLKPALVKYEQPVDFWAIGDSWLDDILRAYPDLVTALRPLGYDVVNEPLGHTDAGLRLEQIATDGFLSKLRRDLGDAFDGIGGVVPPRVILLDGGGNDLVQPKDRPRDTWLYRMLVEGARTAASAIDRKALHAFVTDIRRHHERVLDTLFSVLDTRPRTSSDKSVPILIHAYDHPIPDGRGAMGGPPWMKPVFDMKDIDEATAREVMAQLIDELNDTVHALADDQQALGRNVHHLDLRRTLEREDDFAASHEIYWGDELHPTPEGYDVIAREVARELARLGLEPIGPTAPGPA